MAENKYLIGLHNKAEYETRRILRFLPKVVKPVYAEMYTELFRFRDGFYKDEVEKVRGMSPDVRDKWAKDNLERMGYSTYQRYDYKKRHTGVMCIEIKLKNAVDYLASQSAKLKKHFGLPELRDDLVEDQSLIASCINIAADGVLALFRIDPLLHKESYESVVFHLMDAYKIKVESTDHTFESFPVTYDPNMFIRKWYKAHVYEPHLTLSRKKSRELASFKEEERIQRESFEFALLHNTIRKITHNHQHGYFIQSTELLSNKTKKKYGTPQTKRRKK